MVRIFSHKISSELFSIIFLIQYTNMIVHFEFFKATINFRDNLGHFHKANFWFEITMELCRIKANFFE